MSPFRICRCKVKHQTSQVRYNVSREHITSSVYYLPPKNRYATHSIIMTSIASPTSPYTSSSPTSTTSTTSTSSPTQQRTRVTAEHTLSRVRENQRRHRARRKDYIATLEQKLAETEAQLTSARAEIEALRRERDARQDRPSDNQRQDARADIESEMLALEKLVDTLPMPPLGDVFAFDLVPEIAPLPALEDPAALSSTGPPPCCTDPEPVMPSRAASPECSSCHTRPAPAPTESTTLCAQAYVLIAQQNFRGIDAGTIRLWLYQGYRRARRDGEGCRVENGALFRLLDYISGV
jgi:hypothetical protein